MDAFPHTLHKPARANFKDEPDDNSVEIGSTASGYLVLNKLITFDPRTFSFDERLVIDSHKLIIMAFYESHKDVPFYWYNVQDKTQYEVAFVSKPVCVNDGRDDLWRINFAFRQTTP